MAKYIVYMATFIVLVCIYIGLVQCANQCKTHADCGSGSLIKFYCCGGWLLLGNKAKERSCRISSCINTFCSNDTDCGDPSMCCRSNTCVNKGCSGCTKNSDCYSTHVCCKKTSTFDQTICADNCINQTCNSNDDCGGRSECCRSGKCTNNYKACRDKCASNSECNLDQYCCKKKSSNYWGDSCGKSCVGEICRIDDDCGARNECCISNKCVDRGCSGCTINSNCSTGHYCCKKRQWYELSECSEHCVGKSCSTSDDCGGPGETCGSEYRCAVKQNSNTASYRSTTSKSFPDWLTAVITISLVVFFIAVGVILAVFWYVKRKQLVNATQAGTVSLQNTRYPGAEIQNQQLNTQFSGLNNPTAFHNQLQHGNNVAQQSHNPIHYPQGFQNFAQGTQNQGPVFPNPSPQQENENHGFRINPSPNYDDQGHHTAMSSHLVQSDNEAHQNHNQLLNPVHHTLESPEATRDAQFRENNSQQGESNHVYDYAEGNLESNYTSLDMSKVESKPTYQSLINNVQNDMYEQIPVSGNTSGASGLGGQTPIAEPFYHAVDTPQRAQDPCQVYHDPDNCETREIPGRTDDDDPERLYAELGYLTVLAEKSDYEQPINPPVPDA